MCHNSQSASLLSDSGLVMYFSTLPAPSSSAPCILTILTRRLQNFPHPRRFFGFNTSCFWRWKVLYLYRDMGGVSAAPFFSHFPFKIGDLEAHPGKIRGRERKIRGRERKIWGRERKTMRQIGKIGRRKVFSEVKNVNVKSLKNGSKLLDFWSGSLPQPLPKGKGFSKAYPNLSLKGRTFQKPTPTPPWREGLFNFSINAH